MHPDQRLRFLLDNASNLDEATEALFILLSGGYSIWDDGEIYSVRHLVSKVGNIKVEVYAKSGRSRAPWLALMITMLARFEHAASARDQPHARWCC